MEEHCEEEFHNSRYNCTFCNKVFYSLNLLEKHIITHSEEFYTCDVCNKTFQDSNELSAHYVTHLSKTSFPCDICNAGFNLESDLQSHKNTKHKSLRDLRRYKCGMCDKRFEKAVSFDRHFSDHIGGTPFVCQVCNIGYAIESHFIKHNNVEHPPFSDETNRNWKRYGCDSCPLTFVQKVSKHLHTYVHKHKDPFFGCKECEQSFKSVPQLEDHYLTHVEEQYRILDVVASHGCNFCQKLFPSIFELEEHKLTWHKLSPEYLQLAPLAFDIKLTDKVSDVTESEVAFILNTDENIDKSNDSISQNRPIAISNINQGSEDVNMLQSDAKKVSDSVVTKGQVDSPESFYIITENQDGTFDSNMLDSNCVIIIDDEHQIQNVGLDVMISGDEILEINNATENEKISLVPGVEDQFKSTDAVAHVSKSKVQITSTDFSQDIEMTDFIKSHVNHHSAEEPIFEDMSLSHVFKKMCICNICGKKFKSKKGLRYHNYIHTGEKPFSCPVCKKEFRQKTTLHLHQSTHKTVKPCPCEHCGKTFATKARLKLHSVCHEVKSFVCKICGISLRSKQSLDFHSFTHTSNKPFTCEICRKGFIRRSLFEIHQKIHRGESLLYSCPDCGKVCRNATYLKHHRLQHTGEKPFPCNVCPKTYTTKAAMRNHYVLKHTQEVRYRCNACGKPFQLLDLCIKHMESHMAERNHKCDICGLKFKNKVDLHTHSIKHSKQDPYVCDTCKIHFKTIKDLKIHKLKIHQSKHWPNTRTDNIVIDPDVMLDHLSVLDVTEVSNIASDTMIETGVQLNNVTVEESVTV